ncbi:MAG: TIGR01620 family protein, partial [Pseudomonadota bacterium]
MAHKGPVLIDLEGDVAPPVTDAPPVPDTDLPAPTGAAMQMAARTMSGKPSFLARAFWVIAGALLTAVITAAAWDFVTAWIVRSPIVGWTFAGLFGAFVAILLVVALRELAALNRLTRIDGLRHDASQALETQDLSGARAVTDKLVA